MPLSPSSLLEVVEVVKKPNRPAVTLQVKHHKSATPKVKALAEVAPCQKVESAGGGCACQQTIAQVCPDYEESDPYRLAQGIRAWATLGEKAGRARSKTLRAPLRALFAIFGCAPNLLVEAVPTPWATFPDACPGFKNR